MSPQPPTENQPARREYDERKAIILSLSFVIFGLLVIWFAGKYLPFKEETVIVSLLILPVILYLIISGRIVEFTGPGGWSAKMRDTASKTVIPSVNVIVPQAVSRHTQIVKKGFIEKGQLEEIRNDLNEHEPIIMTVVIGGEIRYGRSAMLSYHKALSSFRQFKFIVFLKDNHEFFAFIPEYRFKNLLEGFQGEEFIDDINDGNYTKIKRYPDVYRDSITLGDTNIKALDMMKRLRIEALTVVDSNNRLIGIVEREQILSEMMLSMIPYRT